MIRNSRKILILFVFISSLYAAESEMSEMMVSHAAMSIAAPLMKGDKPSEDLYSINFNDIPITEFIRFVGRISKVNFIFDNRDLEFHVTVSFAKLMSAEDVLKALHTMLRMRGFNVSQDHGFFVVQKGAGGESTFEPSNDERSSSLSHFITRSEKYEFATYKLQYHQGDQILDALKKAANDLRKQPAPPQKMLNAIDTLQWVQATNSLLYSGDQTTIESLKKLIDALDIPLRQVFIEVLVIETDARSGSDFGLQWGAGGHLGRTGFGFANTSPNVPRGFLEQVQGVGPSNPPSGFSQVPIGSGFDLGVIGDLILHKGKSYLSLGALVSALQVNNDTTIVLNQKIITQDNKNSKIFVGDSIPFTGSIVQTVGSGQLTTANIEYRDVGVSLSITPKLGEGDVITLEITEEISESVTNLNAPNSSAVNGIQTTKTNMMTHAHVPDKHFLVLSGMMRSNKMRHKAGLPCLGSLPVIGSLFSHTKKREEKRNVIIFVRPQIINSIADYQNITKVQPGADYGSQQEGEVEDGSK